MKKGKVYIKTLGCDKNTVDTQVMTATLRSGDFEVVAEPAEADIIVVNTCCFIDDAKRESIDAIFELLPYRTEGKCQRFIIAGCMAQRYAEELAKEIPEADAFVGVNNLEDILRVCCLSGKSTGEKKIVADEASSCFQEAKVMRDTEPNSVTAYLKIGEGCSRHCTYCAIPAIRGPFRSRRPEAILAEAKALYEKGIRECVLIAQDLTAYGKDLSVHTNLAALLDTLAATVPFTWIRLLYLYPEGIDEELLQVMARYDNICHYIDMPIQHTEDRILKRMGRHIDKHRICDIVKVIRTAMPDVVLRTTVITGFPGETEEEYQGLMETLKDLRFDRLGAFAYSQEEDTPAAAFPDQVDESVRIERRNGIYEQQQLISHELNRQKIGREMMVLVEEKDEDFYIGRTYGDAPDIDCGVVLEGEKSLCLGQFYKVKIKDALPYDLIGGVL